MTKTSANRVTLTSTPTEFNPNFILLESTYMDSLGIRIDSYEHKATKARHLHLASESIENVFVVAFPTLPSDSSGVAHILEHTVLCGSEKYPVRDPFFMMMRRSLNTFMNAFTSSDWTAYPFATENKKDFNNLLGVYLDAAFFSRLDPLDFAQEGHRLEFAQGDNPETPLEIKGVVYNEMKGAMSSPVSQLYHRLKSQLCNTTTYHFNSGGDPSVIPRLSYEQLLDFYKSHYHPTNSLFCTFGNIPALEHQTQFETLCLNRFTKGKRYYAPIEVPVFAPTAIEESYAYQGQDTDNQCHFVIGWLLPELSTSDTSLSPTEIAGEELGVELLFSLLCSNSASPLRYALENAPFGSPSPLTGYMSVGRQSMFGCGFQGCQSTEKEQMQTLIFNTLNQAAETGFDKEDIQAGLFQMELDQKEIKGHSQPYGLELALDVMTAGFYDRPLAAAIDRGPAIEVLKQKLKQPDYLQNILKTMVLENPHRTSLMFTPDTEMTTKKEAWEKKSLANQKAQLTPAEIKNLVKQAQALAVRQAQIDDDGLLPKLELTDIPKEKSSIVPSSMSQAQFGKDRALTVFERKTNGLVYFQAATQLPDLTPEEVGFLNPLHQVWAEVGAGQQDYLSIQKEHFASTKYLTAGISLRPASSKTDELSGYSVLRACTLNAQYQKMLKQSQDQFYTVRFDENERLLELLQQQKLRAVQSISGSGHSLALNASNAGYHSYSSFNQDLSGLNFIQRLNQQKLNLDTIAIQAQMLDQVHTKIKAQTQHFCIVGETNPMSDWISQLETSWHNPTSKTPVLAQYQLGSTEHQAWLASIQINFCAMSIPAVDRLHPDSPALDVLAMIMNNQFLHTALREKGGAYGGGAMANSKASTFSFYSYRDPRITGTFDDFFRAMDWAKSTTFTERHREEAILSIISGIDKPGSPSGDALQEFQALLHQRSLAERQAYRRHILEVSADDLKRVASTYFNQEQHTKIVVTNEAKYKAENLNNFSVHII